MAERENAGNDPTLNNPSQDGQDTSSEMLKPWMKTLGKDFYKNETLGKYDSLKDAVNALLSRPEAKATPESYGYGDADELYRKAGATKEEADAIEKYWQSKMPEQRERKETFGDRFDEMDRWYSKAVAQFGDEKEIKKNGLDRNPEFQRLMAKVGKELGSSSFNPSPRDGNAPRRNAFAEIRKNYGNR